MPTGPLYGWSKYRKRPKEVWKFFRMRAVLTKLCHTPEMAAYRQALLQGRVVALKDWTQARVTDAQQATDEIMQDTDNVKPETRLRAAESILSRQERYEQVQRDEGRPKITIDIQAAAAFADVVEDAEVRVIDVPDTEDTAKGRALVDNQSSTGEAEGS
jgi:GAF domain-containing protein